MPEHELNRRAFLCCGAAGLAAASSMSTTGPALARSVSTSKTLAVNGGDPVRTSPFPSWPQITGNEEQQLIDVLRSGKWFRGGANRATQFEGVLAKTFGTNFALATASGTTALLTALAACDVQAGDEVLVSSYSFIASSSVIFQMNALPIFIDSDPDTFLLDPELIEEKITDRTRAIIPVHHGGYPCDMDRIMAVARKHDLKVIEDACQAHLAQFRGKNVGTFGDIGCLSFQVSKNLPSGEGGACLGDDEQLLDYCRWYHDIGTDRKQNKGYYIDYPGTNFRITEWQAAVLLEQIKGLEDRAVHRQKNVDYLCEMLADIEGFAPARFVDGGNRGAFYNLHARIHPEKFKGLGRDAFIRALGAEGIPCWGSWPRPLNREACVEVSLQSRGFRRLFPADYLDQYPAAQHCPVSEEICNSMVVISQTCLLGTRTDMEQIAEAVRKIYDAADTIA
ncbi:MAG: DegT/DnrJ/EryC1/StrS family aminotransferase [Acidobacteriota bacterium]|nr:MAG: DegT/DnrJ/EryC1/StrS family aminotransferase [Acidobacteriota bacterium]